MTPEVVDKLTAILVPMSIKDLREASKIVRAIWDYRTTMLTRKFSVRQRITWTTKGVRHTGTVTKVNQKTLSVRETEGEMWTVYSTSAEMIDVIIKGGGSG